MDVKLTRNEYHYLSFILFCERDGLKDLPKGERKHLERLLKSIERKIGRLT